MATTLSPIEGVPMSVPSSDREGAPRVARSRFLKGGALAVAGAGALGAAALGDSAGAPRAAASPPVRPNPHYRRPRVTRLATLTGPGITTRFRMEATDLGIPAVTPDGRILMVFGDTFEHAKVGDGWWRSPVALYADKKKHLHQGLRWTGAVGGESAEELVKYAHDSAPVSTILPGDVITIGDTMYLWMMVNHGFSNVGSTEIWTSKDSGETWDRTAEMFPGEHLDGLSQQCTWELNPEDGHVYLLTTGFQRDKPIILQRVPAGKILDPEAYETWGEDGGDWAWGNPPTPILDGSFGEMCWRIVEGKWVFTWFNAGLYRIDCIIADGPTADLTKAFHETLLWGCDWGHEDDERVAQLYGGYILPGSRLDDLHLSVSQWRTGPDWPYHVQQFRIRGLGRALKD